MAEAPPYLPSTKNLGAIFDKIRVAGTPPRFTYDFLKANLGFPSSNDRGVITILKRLGFLSADGTPTQRYNDYRHATRGDMALAFGLREGWKDLFLSDERAFERTQPQLTELFKSTTGKNEEIAKDMAATFRALAAKADWTSGPAVENVDEAPPPSEGSPAGPTLEGARVVRLHHDIHLHLPPTSDVAVFTAIFRALRDELLD